MSFISQTNKIVRVSEAVQERPHKVQTPQGISDFIIVHEISQRMFTQEFISKNSEYFTVRYGNKNLE